MSTLGINMTELEKIERAIRTFPGNAEKAINDVLHNEGSVLIQEAIRPLIPESRKSWKGKKAPARIGNSLRSTNENLTVWIRTTKSYQYLYFPNDGSSTQRHVGNQQFFFKGAESVRGAIVERCIGRLIQSFDKGE